MITLAEQYVIYDFNSFVADWGGYMGLVLGFDSAAWCLGLALSVSVGGNN